MNAFNHPTQPSSISNQTHMNGAAKAPTVQPARFLTPSNYQEAWQISEMLAQSEMVPKDYRGKPADILIAMAMGSELGFQPLQSIQNIAVINGRPSVWGDAFRAMIVGSPDLVDLKEWFDENTRTAHCHIKRRLSSGTVAEFNGAFSEQDAKTANLWGKQGPWTQYPRRQQQWRALGFAGRDAYADRLRGIWIDAEAQDLPPEKEINPKEFAKDTSIRSALEEAKRVIPEETEAVSEQAPSLDKFQELCLAVRDCTDMESLTEVKEAAIKAGNNGEFSKEQGEQLKKALNSQRLKITAPVDTETGEVKE
ncbi:transcriptional regulator [Shewanella algae]|uniref:transcriptional regulator n=1 Tax=Shewanella algae TaxID=38313 RepID=UPI001184B513|nr:transcriptional regulator [Shewanella algae]TVP04770.1 hypothetical protein AYI73_15940 [Shewanella algae]